MNLHQIVRGAINRVNPDQLATVWISKGNTTAADGSRVPSYEAPVTNVPVNVQPLSPADIKQIDSLNIERVDRAIYVNGTVRGIERVQMKGGDLFRVLGKYWLVTVVLEPWDSAGWSKVGVTQQTAGPAS